MQLHNLDSSCCTSIPQSLRKAVAISYDTLRCTVPSASVSGTRPAVAAASNAAPMVNLVVSSRLQKRKMTRAQADVSRVEKQLKLSQSQHFSRGMEHLEQVCESVGVHRFAENAQKDSFSEKSNDRHDVVG